MCRSNDRPAATRALQSLLCLFLDGLSTSVTVYNLRQIPSEIILKKGEFFSWCLTSRVDEGMPHTDPQRPLKRSSGVDLQLDGDSRFITSLAIRWSLSPFHVKIHPIVWRWAFVNLTLARFSFSYGAPTCKTESWKSSSSSSLTSAMRPPRLVISFSAVAKACRAAASSARRKRSRSSAERKSCRLACFSYVSMIKEAASPWSPSIAPREPR